MFSSPVNLRWGCAALALCCACSLTALESSRIRIHRIAFERIGSEDWWRTRIELSGSGTAVAEPTGAVRNPRFLDEVTCSLYLSFRGVNEPFLFFESRVDLVTLEHGKIYNLDFFLPGEVVRRDRLDTEPFAYFVHFSIAGKDHPFVPQSASSTVQSESAREALVRHCALARSHQLGVLLPSYHAPAAFTLREEGNYPPFRRKPAALP